MKELNQIITQLEELFTYLPSHESEDMMCWGTIKDKEDKSMQYVQASEVEEILEELKVLLEESK